jgi:hypothetical protein
MKVYVITTKKIVDTYQYKLGGGLGKVWETDIDSVWLDADKAHEYWNSIKDEKFASICMREVTE